MRVFTIGHSTTSIDAFIETLRAHGVALLVDVRRFPASRRHPQYGGTALAAALRDSGLDYLHLPALGGRRAPRRDSRNTAWRNASFRGYADHMESEEYRRARQTLADEAAVRPAAIMCAEKLWWQCHRGLIADDLKAAGYDVLHILSAARVEPHPYTGAARLVNGRLTYEGLLPP
jgi:uncharacterized protein (DUF488 family)